MELKLLMKGVSNPDGWVRLDFPGGWKGDKKNAFTQVGLTGDEISVQELVKTLANFRKNSSAIKNRKDDAVCSCRWFVCVFPL